MEKKIFISFILTLFLLIFIPAYGLTESSRQGKALVRITSQSAESGAEIYISTCASCHGQQGEGVVGPALRNTKLEREALTKAISFGRLAQVIPMPALGEEMGGPLKKHQVEDVVNFIKNWDQSLIIRAQAKHTAAVAPSKSEAANAPPARAAKDSQAIEKTPTLPQATEKALVESPGQSSPVQATAVAPATSSLPSSSEQLLLEGKELYTNFGCAACHGSEAKGAMGPSLLGKTKDEMVHLVRSPRSAAMPPFSPERLTDADFNKIVNFLNSMGK